MEKQKQKQKRKKDMSQPKIGSIWKGQGFKIQVIDINDPKNINPTGEYKKTGDVIYEYLSGPVGKIANCKTLDGFHACWKR